MLSAVKLVSISLVTLLVISCTGVNAALITQDNKQSPVSYENIAYGEHPNQIFDLKKANVEGLAPLVIYIHGGGFNAGSHDKVNQSKVSKFLKAGVHHISLEYRFIKHAPLPAAHQDVVRAVQFIRSKAEQWGIDKNRIAAYGGSAGGQLVSYLAWHDDFADPTSDDIIKRESSRLIAVAPSGVQATMDFDWWANNIPGYVRTPQHSQAMSRPEYKQFIKELSVINHISSDDPPTYMSFHMSVNATPPKSFKKIKRWMTHHVNFGIAIETKLKQKGVEVHLKYPGNKVAFEDDVAFLLHHLKDG